MIVSTKGLAGFSLVEVTLALGVTAISLLAIFALLPVGAKTNQTAISQAASTNILSAVAADLRATAPTTPRGGATTSSRFAINIPANPVATSTTTTLFFTTEGQFSATLGPSSRYQVLITFVPNGSGIRTATFAKLKAFWPAAAAITNAEGVGELFVALDRN